MTIRTLAAAALLVLAAVPAAADQLAVDYVDHADVGFYEPWTEQGLAMVVVPASGEAIVEATRYGLLLYRSTLQIDLSTLSDVRTVTVTGKTYGGTGNTYVWLADGETLVVDAYSTVTNVRETLTIDPEGTTVDALYVYSVNYYLEGVTIHHGAVPAEASSWGAVKSLFR